MVALRSRLAVALPALRGALGARRPMILHTDASDAAAARAIAGGVLRSGGVTPRVASSSVTNSRNATGEPSVTK